MRRFLLIVAMVVTVALGLAGTAGAVVGCEGGNAPLATGIRGASAIFYARIRSARMSADGFYTLSLDVGRVVRGQAQDRVARVVTPRACDVLAVGDAGVMVLGSVDPFGIGPNDRYNFFNVIGPGRTSVGEAERVLAVAPATDTPTPSSPSPSAPVMPLGILSGICAGLFVLRQAHERRAERRPGG